MTIAIITANYPPTICGIGDHTFQLVKVLLARGIRVHIICMDTQTAAVSSGETIHPIVKKWDAAGIATVQKLVGEIRPDWVVVQMIAYAFQRIGLPFNAFPLFPALRKSGAKVLTVFHEVRIRPEGDLRRWAIMHGQTFIARRMAKLSDRVVTSIDYYADMIRGAAEINLIPIGTGIAPVESTPAERAELRAKYGIPATAPLVVTFGNRNVEPYLAEFDRLAAEIPGFVWLLTGKNATSAAALKSRPYLRHTGEMSSSDIYKALSLGDVAFMPEPVSPKGEGGSSNKSTALAAALSLGVPVIGVAGDLNNRLLKHGENIFLVKIHEPGALFEALQICLGDGPARERLGQNARDFFEKKLAWPVLGEQFLKLMDAGADIAREGLRSETLRPKVSDLHD